MTGSPRGPALLGAVLCAVVLAGCGMSTPDDPPGDETVTQTDGNSHLDRDGVAAIEASRRARFDLSDLSLTRDDVALPPDRMGPIVGSARAEPTELVLQAPEGEERVSTSTFSATFSSSADAADSVTWFESHDSEEEAFAALDDAVGRWGLRTDAVANWRETLALGGEQEVSLPLGVSPSGFVTQVTVRGEAGAGQTHQWFVLLDPRYYEPAALEQIRRTGQLPAQR